MSQEMKSQCSDEYHSSDEDMDEDINNYYEDMGDDNDVNEIQEDDPESFEFELLKVEDVERLLNESVETLCKAINVAPSLAKLLLHMQKWLSTDVIARYRQDSSKLLRDSRLAPTNVVQVCNSPFTTCPVCLQRCPAEIMSGLTCGHRFCNDCWQQHFAVQIQTAVSTGIECMFKDCCVLVPEDFVLQIVTNPKIRDKYQEFCFRDYVNSHPELRFCPGPNCSTVIRATERKAKRVVCKECNTCFCFRCGIDYHAPTDCDTIKKWLTKCADDSETANYISAHTKDCPKCHVCIEKNGGCNHMQCSKCKHDFCWMCLGDWKTHGSEYYECSRYKENPNIANESAHAQAREALKKYLFYFERWENHAKSLQLEEQTLDNIKKRIEEKVMNNSGTWIDWQYLLDAAFLLKKCRYTLQYTYPYAYYLDKGPRKSLFEYQQAQLEAEVENLSWKVERAEITDRGDLENQMDIAEKRRLTLVRDFLEL
ncbi:hypothetical protein LSH36_85g05039 [Paralvinella palmiformis]|uniref:RBR-type E3 ubiquitin transferase n=1 Tax=Paralvinella palmiformis TaxID=53620 RepID=A0AAD9K1H5_9ANNE|nr:hypothetical protein LSH36_85g05039 [Paralvinella palmiformis]